MFCTVFQGVDHRSSNTDRSMGWSTMSWFMQVILCLHGDPWFFPLRHWDSCKLFWLHYLTNWVKPSLLAMLKCDLLIFFGSILFVLSSLHWWASCIWFSSPSLCSHGKHPKVFAYTSICTSVVSPLSKQSIVIQSPNCEILVFKAYEMLVTCGYGGLPGSGNYLDLWLCYSHACCWWNLCSEMSCL